MEIPNNAFYAPLEEDVKASALALEHLKKRAKLDSYNVRIFNMSLPADVDAYTKLMGELLDGIQAKTHFIWAKERTLIDGVWKIYLEWCVYKISSEVEAPKANEPEAEKDTNEQAI